MVLLMLSAWGGSHPLHCTIRSEQECSGAAIRRCCRRQVLDAGESSRKTPPCWGTRHRPTTMHITDRAVCLVCRAGSNSWGRTTRSECECPGAAISADAASGTKLWHPGKSSSNCTNFSHLSVSCCGRQCASLCPEFCPSAVSKPGQR